jgi:sialate O-acetylesterase
MKVFSTVFFLIFSIGHGLSQIQLPRLISDGVVLQRNIDVRIWGSASANETVELLFGGKIYKTNADQNGNWQIPLPPQDAGGPFEMIFRGKNEVKISDILFGDVWICSGQSNMELTMDRVKDKYPSVIAASENPMIRQFLVPDKYDFKIPHHDLDEGDWKKASPQTIRNFSAVAYFFAREIYEKYHVPIGLINAALGGSPVEAWMSAEGIKNFPEAFSEYKKFQNDDLIKQIEQSDKLRSQKWFEELNNKDVGIKSGKRQWISLNIDDSDWEEMKNLESWALGKYGAVNGSMWFRKIINVPKSMVGIPARLWLGRVVDSDSVFINGKFTGTTSYRYPPRKYDVAPDVLNEGKNIIAVRVISQSGNGGFITDKPYFLATEKDTLSIMGPWRYKLGAEMPALAGSTAVRWKPVGLYNHMIAPLLKFNIKGVLWYQGESNTSNALNYTKLLSALIEDWRQKWNQGNFPFVLVQLPNFMEVKEQPVESEWAQMRYAQLQTLAVPNTALVVAIDLGEWNDIHPLNKADIGKRLALQVRKIAYGEKNLVASGPVPKHAIFTKKNVTIDFENAANGLISKNNKILRGFSVSSDGKKFYWADAKIAGTKVIVSNKNVNNPSVVRYAWADNPASANLYNKELLPATPFEISAGKPDLF